MFRLFIHSLVNIVQGSFKAGSLKSSLKPLLVYTIVLLSSIVFVLVSNEQIAATFDCIEKSSELELKWNYKIKFAYMHNLVILF